MLKKPVLAKTLLEMSGVFEELLASLSTLQSLGQTDLQLVDEQTLLRKALRALVEHYGVERCSIFLREGEQLVNAAGFDWQDWQSLGVPGNRPCLEPQSYPILASLMGLALRSGEPQISADCRNDPRFAAPAGEAPPSPMGSLLCAPIRVGGQILGAINLSHPEIAHFNDWNSRLVTLFSDFLGQILTSNRLLKSLEEEVAARTLQLETVLTETQLLKEHYKRLSLVDELTGLYNRRHFFAESHIALSRAVRYRHPFTLLVIDLDRFKQINDLHGHSQGDLVLKDVGDALQGQLRDTDLLARVGGEEFAIILPETSQDGAREAAQRLLQAVRKLRWNCAGAEVRITLSAGMVFLDAESTLGDRSALDINAMQDRLYSLADTGMYEAKRQGGNRVEEAAYTLA